MHAPRILSRVKFCPVHFVCMCTIFCQIPLSQRDLHVTKSREVLQYSSIYLEFVCLEFFVMPCVLSAQKVCKWNSTSFCNENSRQNPLKRFILLAQGDLASAKQCLCLFTWSHCSSDSKGIQGYVP